jgi:hypothetical protein
LGPGVRSPPGPGSNRMGKTGYAVILNEVNNLNLRPKKQDASFNSE